LVGYERRAPLYRGWTPLNQTQLVCFRFIILAFHPSNQQLAEEEDKPPIKSINK